MSKKEGKLKQEMLDGEDTLQTMKMGDTRLMKRGQRASIMKHMSPIGKYDHSYKKTDARIAEDEAGNAAWDFRHGYTSEGKYEERKAENMIRRDGGLFGRKFGRDGLVKGTKQRRKYARRGKQG